MKLSLTLFLSTLVTIGIIACSKDNNDSSYSYGGPGSEWNVSIGTGTTGSFTITYAATVGGTTSMTVNGSYERLTSGYTKFTVSSASGTDAPSAGDLAYGLEIPGFALMLKPMGDGDIIPMVVSGSCPTSTSSSNWIVTNYGGSNAYSTSADILGTFTYNPTTGSATLPTRYALNSYTSVGAGTAMTGTCSGGKMAVGSDLSNPDANMWMTSSGAALVKTNHDDGIIVAMPSTAISAASALAGDYSGVLFNEGDTTAGSKGTTIPVKLVINGAGSTAIAYDYTDVDTGTTSSSVASMTIDAINSPSNGFIKLTLSSKEMICQVSEDIVSSGKNMLFCAGISPDDSTKLFNVLLVSK